MRVMVEDITLQSAHAARARLMLFIFTPPAITRHAMPVCRLIDVTTIDGFAYCLI